MKLFARVDYDKESGGEIIRSFFLQNVSSVKRIQKVDGYLWLEFDVSEDKPATELINAISDSDIEEFVYGSPFEVNEEEHIEDSCDFRELTNPAEDFEKTRAEVGYMPVTDSEESDKNNDTAVRENLNETDSEDDTATGVKSEEEGQNDGTKAGAEPEESQDYDAEAGAEPEEGQDYDAEARAEPEEGQNYDAETGAEPEEGQDYDAETGAEPEEGQDDSTEAGAEPEEGQDDSTEAGAEPEKDQNDGTEVGVKPEEGQNDDTENGDKPKFAIIAGSHNLTTVIYNIVKVSDDFESFFKTVIETFEVGKKADFIKLAVEVAAQGNLKKWDHIEKRMVVDLGYHRNSYDKVFVQKQVRAKVNDEPTTKTFILEIAKYRNFKFSTATKKLLTMDCFPNIPEFNEKLAQMNENTSLEDKVKYVLVCMGLEKQPADRQPLIEKLMLNAVENHLVNIQEMTECFGHSDGAFARACTMDFINEFLKENGSTTKVKVEEFVNSLITMLM